MIQISIFVTKPPPELFCSRGMDACRAWFNEPVFRDGYAFDPAFETPLAFSEIVESDWYHADGNVISGKILQKMGASIQNDVWKAILNSYKIELVPGKSVDFYNDLEQYYCQAFHKLCYEQEIKSELPTSGSDKEVALLWEEHKRLRKIACESIESVPWYQWIYELKIDLSKAS